MFHEFSIKAHEARLSHTSGMAWEDLNDRSNGLKELLIIMVAEWFVFLFVSYCLDNKSSVFYFRRKPNPFSQRTSSRDFSSAEKADIAQEREKVEELLVRPDRSYSIVCDNLGKVYPGMDGNPRKLAVHGLSLALGRGECFGILGPNGAGKSTFIKMVSIIVPPIDTMFTQMIGLTWPSAGTAFVEGLNIQTELERVYTSMGVCPQHEQWKNLLAVSIYSMEELVTSKLVVYMDEPSTGLDPASRNELWKVVMRAKRNKVIIITTHSMEEAEHLCDRVGIFVDGRLECIGNAKQAWGIADTTLEDVFIKVARGAKAFNVI
ncbi:hypothetical protein RHMOL_Rhmol08G0262300 [Rhododendron molle]|uniref:Uncharacterized protein n=1 Tax=Rhododendron molle TaxID=49168 RepID=A0ACC0MSI9_RHOML|nr:hypothetical protein RHMOL_Rhmol08G0262300 [Rhododendron molle]